MRPTAGGSSDSNARMILEMIRAFLHACGEIRQGGKMVYLVSCDNTDGKAKVLDKIPAAKHWQRAERRKKAIAYSQGRSLPSIR